jgi:hypothetical protein
MILYVHASVEGVTRLLAGDQARAVSAARQAQSLAVASPPIRLPETGRSTGRRARSSGRVFGDGAADQDVTNAALPKTGRRA